MKTRQICLALLTSAAFICGFAQAQSAPKVADGVLVRDTGMTLYSFDKDVAGSGKSTCNGPCAANWPPVAVPAKLPSGKYSVVTRDDGSTQLAYDGKPLYLYAADKKAGERTGDNFKNVWHLVKE